VCLCECMQFLSSALKKARTPAKMIPNILISIALTSQHNLKQPLVYEADLLLSAVLLERAQILTPSFPLTSRDTRPRTLTHTNNQYTRAHPLTLASTHAIAHTSTCTDTHEHTHTSCAIAVQHACARAHTRTHTHMFRSRASAEQRRAQALCALPQPSGRVTGSVQLDQLGRSLLLRHSFSFRGGSRVAVGAVGAAYSLILNAGKGLRVGAHQDAGIFRVEYATVQYLLPVE
jgi:hypothetical protein